MAGQVSASTSVSLRVILIDIISYQCCLTALSLLWTDPILASLSCVRLLSTFAIMFSAAARIASRTAVRAATNTSALSALRPAVAQPFVVRTFAASVSAHMCVCVRCKGMLQFITQSQFSRVLFIFLCAGLGDSFWLGLLTNGTIPTCRQRGSFGGMLGVVEISDLH